jgi:hypothetical protein
MNEAPSGIRQSSQILPLVFGGEPKELHGTEFRDPAELDIVGIFPNFTSAYAAWRAKARRTVDNAPRRCFIVHLHQFRDPAPDRA